MPSKLKILLLDIETAPHQVYVWSLWDQGVQIDRLIEPKRTLCWAAKWFGQTTIHFKDERDGKKRMVQGIHRLMSEADIIITYNGRKFDLPVLNNEFIKYGFAPVRPNKHIDLYQTAKAQFQLASNKLSYVAEFLELSKTKIKHKGFALWRGCLAGNAEDWATMKEYNIGDVALLEQLYIRLRPWVKNHPDVRPDVRTEHCADCGSDHVHKKGHRETKEFSIVRLHCQDCGGWTDGTKVRRKPIKPRAA
jgi:DNA polymerase elongation subunit (family B)